MDGDADIGTLGGTYGESIGINDRAQVTGWADTVGGASHAFLYSARTGMKDLGTLGGSYSQGCGINDRGQITGLSYLTGDATYHAFLYSAKRGMKDLGTLGGSWSVGLGINNFRHVTGYSWTGNYDEEGNETYHAFLYRPREGMKDLGTLGGSYSYAYSQGYSINNSGQITGTSTNPAGLNLHAFLYSKGRMTDLNTLLAPSSVWNFLY